VINHIEFMIVCAGGVALAAFTGATAAAAQAQRTLFGQVSLIFATMALAFCAVSVMLHATTVL
jgi:hypothetical protein